MTSHPQAAAAAGPSSGDAPENALPEILCCQPMQMLTRIARQSSLGDPDGCTAILALLATSRIVRAHLQLVLGQLELTEIKFFTLVSLYALDPDPYTPAELALQSQVSRAAMSDTIESLHGSGWIDRKRSQADRRRLHVRLTQRGRSLVEQAVRPFLGAIGRCSDTLTAEERRALIRTCAHLCDYFQPSPSV